MAQAPRGELDPELDRHRSDPKFRGQRVQPETRVGEKALVDGRDTVPVRDDHGG